MRARIRHKLTSIGVQVTKSSQLVAHARLTSTERDELTRRLGYKPINSSADEELVVEPKDFEAFERVRRKKDRVLNQFFNQGS